LISPCLIIRLFFQGLGLSHSLNVLHSPSHELHLQLVLNSSTKYTYSQPTVAQQVAWQVKKEEEGHKALCAESTRMHEAQSKRDFTPSPLSTSFSTSYSAPSYSTPSYSAPSYSAPSYSTSSSSTYPSFNCTNYGRVI